MGWGPAVRALEVTGLTHDFGGLRALDGVSLAVEAGERLVILGPNGAGKTTLFNVVTGLLRPTGGRIHLLGEEVSRLAPHARARRGLGRTFQVTTLFPGLTVLDSVRRTGRALIVHEAVQVAGFGAEIAAVIAEEGAGRVRRLGAPRAPVGYAPVLEAQTRVTPQGIVEAARALMKS